MTTRRTFAALLALGVLLVGGCAARPVAPAAGWQVAPAVGAGWLPAPTGDGPWLGRGQLEVNYLLAGRSVVVRSSGGGSVSLWLAGRWIADLPAGGGTAQVPAGILREGSAEIAVHVEGPLPRLMLLHPVDPAIDLLAGLRWRRP